MNIIYDSDRWVADLINVVLSYETIDLDCRIFLFGKYDIRFENACAAKLEWYIFSIFKIHHEIYYTQSYEK